MIQDSQYRICAKTVMDTIADPDIVFDENGISNYYYDYFEKAPTRLFNTEKDRPMLDEIVKKMKTVGLGKEYDCIIGVSGGVDSTYVAYMVKKLGLRPLAVHFDNGWNSELAVKNIEQVLKRLDIDLYTFVIDWEEFKSLQYSFLKASTPDGEIPTDHAISALLYQVANEKNVKYIVNGYNFSTESILPVTWSYGHIDWSYIRKINARFGDRRLRNYPHITPFKYFYYTFIRGIRMMSLLNYIPYQKNEAMKILQEELGWKYYGGKHYESIYTRFFQGHILPQKFKIDKRKAHLSNLILSGQITREEALEELEKPIYPHELLNEDRTFVLKKFGLNEEAFSALMSLPLKTFRDYPNQYNFIRFLKRRLNALRGRGVLYS